MKLRLRSSESKETLRIEVPNSCTLFQLKQILSHTLCNSASPVSLRLSLNRKDELHSDGEDSLHSLGITAGDLIFYSLEQPFSGTGSISKTLVYPGSSSSRVAPDSGIPECSTSFNSISEGMFPEGQKSDMVGSASPKRESPETCSLEDDTVADMEIEADNEMPDGVPAEIVDKSFSEPGFLRKVFMEELGDDGGRDHKLIVIAVHAVLLESGFVECDMGSNALRREWPSGMFRLSLFYTLPDILNGNDEGSDPVKCVVKFQSLGKFINVYGSISGGIGKNNTHLLRLNEDQLVPFLNVVWANCGVRENVVGDNGSLNSTSTSPEKEVFKFWQVVKDSLSLPLLIDMCEKVGLALPPCFMRLPTDIKMKILESLPGVDVAKVTCACSELRYLASSEDLWKLKFKEEYGNDLEKGQGSWKIAFVRMWENRKSANRFANRVVRPSYQPMPMHFGGRRYGIPHRPGVVGGYYDIYGNDALQNEIHTLFPHHRANWSHRANWKFSPRCNLGGSTSRGFI